MTNQDITNLCAAIDAGDDSALPVLADALEDAGDARAAGMRRVAARYSKPETSGDGKTRWYRYAGRRADLGWRYHAVADELFARLEEAESWTSAGTTTGGDYLEYPSRSAAFLALAEVV